jgi:hypothetical protein
MGSECPSTNPVNWRCGQHKLLDIINCEQGTGGPEQVQARNAARAKTPTGVELGRPGKRPVVRHVSSACLALHFRGRSSPIGLQNATTICSMVRFFTSEPRTNVLHSPPTFSMIEARIATHCSTNIACQAQSSASHERWVGVSARGFRSSFSPTLAPRFRLARLVSDPARLPVGRSHAGAWRRRPL